MMKKQSTNYFLKMKLVLDLPSKEYYHKAIDSIPHDHPHRDEIVSLLIDQVLDDNGNTKTDSTTSTA